MLVKIIVILVLGCIVFSSEFPPDCSKLSYGSNTYDLSGLTALGIQEQQGSHTTSYYYRYFVCGEQGQTCGNVAEDCGVCSAWEGRWNENPYTYCEGMYTESKTEITEYRNGDDLGIAIEYGYADGGSVSNMLLICDLKYSGFEKADVDNTAIYNPVITVRTKDACPHSQTPFPPDCSNIVFANRKYDLSNLQSLGVQETRGSSTSYYYDYRWFVCGDQAQTCGTATDSCAVCSAFEGRWHDPSFTACEGKYSESSVKISEHTSSGVKFDFAGGDMGSVSEIILACDPRYSGLEQVFVDNTDVNRPSIFVRTRDACPQTIEEQETKNVVYSANE